LESVPDFGDPFSMPFETQWRLFATAVQKSRPDIDDEFLAQALPREPQRVRSAIINLRS
jgi:hypothetical protein